MGCNLKNRHELIANYLVGELPEDEAKSFEEHYFQCEICFKELKAVEEAINLIEREGPSILAAGKPTEKNLISIIKRLTLPDLSAPKRWRIAVTAAAAVAIFLMLLTTRNDQGIINNKVVSKDNGTSERKDTLSKKGIIQNDDMIAELSGPAFKAIPYLEEWITESVRSDNDKIDTVLYPRIGEKFHDEDIIFKWRMVNNKIASLKILNNIEKEIFTSTPEEMQSPLFSIKVGSKTIKQSGLYYWRLEDENEVLFVGKFYFLK